MSKLSKILKDAKPKLSWQQRYQYKDKAFNQKRFQLTSLITLVLMAVALVLMLVDTAGIQTGPYIWVVILVLQLITLVIMGVEQWIQSRQLRFKVVELLRQDGIMPGACPKCNYDLSHSESSQCSECGFEVGPVDHDRNQ